MAKSYKVYDTESGRVVSEIKRVADTVRLATVGTSSGSLSATCTSTDNLWPGMLLIGLGLAAGTTVASVDSATAFTLSLAATATNASRFVQALSYIPYKADGTVATKAIHLEHFRDQFTDSTPLTMIEGTGVIRGNLKAPGVVVYPDDAEYTSVTTFGVPYATPVSCTGTATVAVSDHLSHTPPREQSQTCSFVHFILDDGTLLPVLRMPSYDIVSAA